MRNYLEGRARGPYLHTPTLKLKDYEQASTDRGEICPRCSPVLSMYVDTFKSFVDGGSHSKSVKPVNRSLMSRQSVVTRQNEWLRENIFDHVGNYLFCSPCVCLAFHISRQRLTYQQTLKRQVLMTPLVEEERC